MRKVMTLAVATLMLAAAACSKKSGGSSGGGVPAAAVPPPSGGAPTSFAGQWTFIHKATSGDGTCDIIGNEHEVGKVNVSEGGTFGEQYHFRIDGAITNNVETAHAGPHNAHVSFTITQPEPCGNGTAEGTCDTYGNCSGTYSQTGTSPHSGEWRFTR